MLLARPFIAPDKVGSVPSTEPDTQEAHIPSFTDTYHVPESNKPRLAVLQTDAESPLCPG